MQPNTFALWPMTSAVATVTQLTEPGNDARQASQDALDSISAIWPRPGARRVQTERHLRLFHERRQIVSVVDTEPSLLQHSLGSALD